MFDVMLTCMIYCSHVSFAHVQLLGVALCFNHCVAYVVPLSSSPV